MPILPSRLTAERAAIEYTKRHARKYIIALLGDGSGNVEVAGRDKWVYIRLEADDTQLTQAKLKSAIPMTEDIAIMVERVLTNGATNYQVIGIAPVPDYPNSAWDGSVGDHADNHEIRDFGAGGTDKLNVYTRARVELRARAQTAPDMTLYVEHGKYPMLGVETFWNGGNSPTFTAPATGYKRIDLLYFDSANTLQIKTGTAVASSLYSFPSYPAAPTGAYCPVAYVLLQGGQTTIAETSIADARIAWGSLGTAGLASHNILDSTYHGDTLTGTVVRGDLIIGNSTPKWSRLALGGITGSVLTRNATDVLWSTGGLSFGGAYTLTIAGNSSINGTAIVGTPGSLTVSTPNAAADPHTHAITSSSNPGAAASLLATSSSGGLQLAGAGFGVAPVVGSAGQRTILNVSGTGYSPTLFYWYGATFSITYVSASNSQSDWRMYGAECQAIVESGAGNATNVFGGSFTTIHNGAGTIASQRSGDFVAQSGVSSGTATTTNLFCGRFAINKSGAGTWAVGTAKVLGVQIPTSSAGTLSGTLLYGLHLEDFSAPGGTWGTAYAIYATGGQSYHGGNLGLGSQTVPVTLLHATLNNATTNVADNIVTIGHNSTGTPAAGFGAGLLWTLESSTTADTSAARIYSAWYVATHASRQADLVITVYDTAEREGIRIRGSGSAAMLGFYGVTPVVRPTALTAQLTTLTYTAPGTPDYAIQDLTNSGGYGYATKDEGNSVLKVIANLQTRVSELETKLQGLGLLT